MLRERAGRVMQIVVLICGLIILMLMVLAVNYSTKAFQYKTYIKDILIYMYK